jgi:hypothetical protein
MKKVLFFILATFSSIFSVQTVEAFKGCENKRMNELCLSPEVDRCYTCLNTEQNQFRQPPVCVPIFHQQHLGTLDNYPSNKWNCTLYSPEVNSNEEFVKDICKVDEFISNVCQDQDKNGFCMIANYINDICQQTEEEHRFEETDYTTLNYVSPWGHDSVCEEPFYQKVCTGKLVKYCFDARKYIGKDGNKDVYLYNCHPFYYDNIEASILSFLNKEKYVWKKWYNKNYNPNTNEEDHRFETEDVFRYPACSGPICQKDGWIWKKTVNGKDWCGSSTCVPFGKTMFVCNYPSTCGKKLTSVESYELQENNEDRELNLSREFHTMGCGKEKFKCLLNKECRELVKRLKDCEEDFACIYQVVSINSNDLFIKLANCMYHN